MSKLPQVNVRLAPEHHGLIREIAQRLRADPSLAVGLADFLAQNSPSNQSQVSPLPYGLADEVADLKERLEENWSLTQAIQERFRIQSEGLQKTTAYADNINERVRVLEQQLADLGQKPASASLGAVGPVEATDTPMTPEALPEPPQEHQKQRRKKGPWTEADYAALRHIADKGGIQADAVRELDRSSSDVNKKWRELRLPVPLRKGRKATPPPPD